MFEDLSDEDRKGLKYAALLGILAVIVAVAVIICTPPCYDKETLCVCEEDVPTVHHRIIVIDTTDKLANFHQRYMREDLLGIIDTSEIGTRFSVYSVDAKDGGLSALEFDMCNPSKGDDVSAIYSNPKLVKKKFEERFMKPLLAKLSALGSAPKQTNSPLVEAISDIFKLSLFEKGAEATTLYLYSDLLQNSRKASVYRGEPLPNTVDCKPATFVDRTYVRMLERKGKDGSLQTEELIEAWKDILRQCSRDLHYDSVRS